MHGQDIGKILGSIEPFKCIVDFDREDDGWVPMTNPATWKNTNQAGWLKKSWCTEAFGLSAKYELIIAEDGTPSIGNRIA